MWTLVNTVMNVKLPIRGRKFLWQLNDCHLLKEGSALGVSSEGNSACTLDFSGPG
jgi:hypothetical protein